MLSTSIVVFSVGLSDAHPTFEQWANEWGINTNGSSESIRLKRNYEENCLAKDRLNEEHPDVTFAVNQFSGMTAEEFSAEYLSETPPPVDTDLPRFESNRPAVEVSDHLFWPITGIRHQSCQSCWAFAATAMIEAGAVHRGAPRTLDLSEKQLFDCGGYSCSGGRSEAAYRGVTSKNIFTEASCPWPGGHPDAVCGACNKGVSSGITITGYHHFGHHSADMKKSESELIQNLQHDSVTANLFADSVFMNGFTGIKLNPPTSDCRNNHAVLIIGYDFRVAGKNYWKIKNSWAASWGESGTARIGRTTSGCGPYSFLKDYMAQADGINVQGSSVEV